MRKFNILILLVLVSTGWSSIHAQQVFESGHYGSPGDLYLYNRFISGFSNEEITQAGEGITWDFSALSNLATHPNEIVEPVEGINQFAFLTICALSGISASNCISIWANTEQALLLQDSLTLLEFTLANLQRYQRVTPDYLLENFIGFSIDLGGTPTQAVIIYQKPDTVIQFPATYGEAWTSSIEFNLDLLPAGQDVQYYSHQSRTTSIDSWGTLVTPFDTFTDVIRLRSEIFREDTIIMNSQPIPITLTQVEYMWLDTNYTLPVMTANGIVTPTDSTIINAMEYIYEATCPAPVWTVGLGTDTFYLDSSGSVTIDFTIEDSNADVYNWSFGDGSFGSSEGNISHVYDSPGTYLVNVSGCMTDCLPLNSCSFQIVEFEILDTITSVTNIPGVEIGIKCYPNPAQDKIHLIIPEDLGTYEYSIFDIMGKRLASGTLKTGLNPIDIQQLNAGSYAFQLISSIPGKDQIAFVRFTVSNR